MNIERSPLGDTRERTCPCRRCQRPTWHWSALCDTHLARELARMDDNEIHDMLALDLDRVVVEFPDGTTSLLRDWDAS